MYYLLPWLQGTTVCQAIVACVIVVLLYTSRAVYNMIAIARKNSNILNFGFGWINVSDQVSFIFFWGQLFTKQAVSGAN